MPLDTFVTILYCLVDDFCKDFAHLLPQRRCGRRSLVSDAEIVTLSILAQIRGRVAWDSERAFVEYIHRHGKCWFPKMLNLAQFNQRRRQLARVVVLVQQSLTESLTDDLLYEVADCTPIRHCTTAHALRENSHWIPVHKGRGGNECSWYIGRQLLICVDSKGVITGWMSGPANADDRWFLQALLSGRQGEVRLNEPPLPSHRRKKDKLLPVEESFSPAITAGPDQGVPVLADGGFNGPRWLKQWQDDYDIEVITPPAENKHWQEDDQLDKTRHRSLRQIVESVFANLARMFSLKKLDAHSEEGLLARLAAVMAGYNFAVFCNKLLGRPLGAVATLIH